MSRRSEPPPIRPRVRMIGGVPHIGLSPWFDCSSCGVVFDPAEFDCCPECTLRAAEAERRWYAEMVRHALERPTVNDSIR